jgi:uncharacterized protein YjbI with pentapeptide repeats
MDTVKMLLSPKCRSGKAWCSIASTLAFALTASFLAACGSGGGKGGTGAVEYFPPGGVSEQMIVDRPAARLNLDNTVVDMLEPTGSPNGDTGRADGVDELPYHFDVPTQIRMSLDDFDEAPTLVALDGSGNEIGRADGESGDVTITASGEHKFRLVHPRAGDPTADPIVIFFRPIRATTGIAQAVVGGRAQADTNDVATLKAGKNCVRCNLTGLSWNACPGVSLAGVNLSHADFTSAVLACQTFEAKGTTPVLLTGAIFNGASLSELTLKEAELTDAQFAGAMFDVTVFDSVTATSANFANSQFENSSFGAAKGTASSARGANFSGAQIIRNSCLSTYDLRGADFSGATFDSTSSVHGTWFAGANLFGATFDGTKFQYDSSLPNCGQPASCTTVTVPGLCENCPCTADLGCLDLGDAASCVQNQGAVTVSETAICQRPTVQATAEGVILQNADLTNVSFNGADLTNSTFASNTLDNTSSFAGSILAGVDFTKQDLGKSVDLSGAYLSQTTDFTGAGLSDATSQQGVILSCIPDQGTGGCDFPAQTMQFKGANMQYAQLDNVGLSQANLQNTNLANASLVGADLNFASLEGASLAGALLGVAAGSGSAASLRGAFMINVNLTDADMRGVDLSEAHLYGATTDALFVRTHLESVDFTAAILAGAVFTNAFLTNATFNGAQLVNANFDGADLSGGKFDDAYLQGADFSTAALVTGMSLSNAVVSTTLTSTMCTLILPGYWTYMDQNGTPYTYQYGETKLQTDDTVVCPNGERGPCATGDSLCPVNSGPYPPIPPCIPVAQYCYENCLTPPCFLDTPDPTCPLVSNCS